MFLQKEHISGELEEKIKEYEKQTAEQQSVIVGLQDELKTTKESLENERALIEKLTLEKDVLDGEMKDSNLQIESMLHLMFTSNFIQVFHFIYCSFCFGLMINFMYVVG